jgi:hypothetical protein
MMGSHIHSLRIRAFALERTNFTENESAHFDCCGVCRLRVRGALRNQKDLVLRVRMQRRKQAHNDTDEYNLHRI